MTKSDAHYGGTKIESSRRKNRRIATIHNKFRRLRTPPKSVFEKVMAKISSIKLKDILSFIANNGCASFVVIITFVVTCALLFTVKTETKSSYSTRLNQVVRGNIHDVDTNVIIDRDRDRDGGEGGGNTIGYGAYNDVTKYLPSYANAPGPNVKDLQVQKQKRDEKKSLLEKQQRNTFGGDGGGGAVEFLNSIAISFLQLVLFMIFNLMTFIMLIVTLPIADLVSYTFGLDTNVMYAVYRAYGIKCSAVTASLLESISSYVINTLMVAYFLYSNTKRRR